jgi:aerobic-type carbon monoxide dehydrogenase small subunit (CoxS/CutS family)
VKISFGLNGKQVTAEARPMDRLLDLLREQFGLTGTKEGCGEGECGACTVLLDGEPVLSCLVPVLQCDGREVLALDPDAQGLLDRFVEKGGTQCGACTPGIIVTAYKLTKGRSRVRREDVRTALAGNLCRCTGYEAILQALTEEAGS